MDQIDNVFRKLARENRGGPDFEVRFLGARSLGSYRGMLTYLERWGHVSENQHIQLIRGTVSYKFRFLVSMEKVNKL